jgi:hypothetical protein
MNASRSRTTSLGRSQCIAWLLSEYTFKVASGISLASLSCSSRGG